MEFRPGFARPGPNRASVEIVDLSTEEGRREWKIGRKKGLGGSEAGTLFNRPGRIVNPWQSRYSLWQDKTTEIIDETDTPQMEWGRRLEDAVRVAYEEKLGRTVHKGAVLTEHPEASYMLANTDGRVAAVPEHDGDGVYEGKTTNVFSKADWSQCVPLLYQVQLQHYSAVLDKQWGSFACLELGASDPFHWGDMERNERFIEALMEEEYKFWTRHVLAGIPPEIDGSEATTKALKLLHPEDNGRVIVLPPEATGWLVERETLGQEMKALKARKDEIDNKLRHAVGPNSFGEIEGGGGGVSYKTQAQATSADLVLQVVRDLLGDQDVNAVRREVNARKSTIRVLRVAGAKSIRAAREAEER